MNQLNPFALSGIMIAITTAPLFILLTIKGRSLLARIFNLYIFCILGWGITCFMWGYFQDIKIILESWKYTMVFVIFMPTFFYHACHILAQNKNKVFLVVLYLQAIFFSICGFNGLLWGKPRYVFNSFYYPTGNELYFCSFIIWIVGITAAHIKLIKYYQIAHPKEKSQLVYLNFLMLGFIAGATNWLPALGIDIYPYANFLVATHACSVGYAILRHQLFDIDLFFKKGAIYSILILILALFYFIIVSISEKLIQGIWGYHSSINSAVTAFIIGILFFPLHSEIQRALDKIIFSKSPQEIFEENALLRQEIIKTEKLKTVATLASGMAHEIKNPLTAIKTFSEYLPKRLEDKEFLARFSRIVGSEVNRIDALVNELLDFAKPAPLKLEEVNINQVLKDSLDFLNSQFVQNQVNVVTNFSTDCNRIILADPSKLKQAFFNLILNAVEAMAPHGGTLTIATRLTSDPTKSFIEVAFSDTGPGITPKDKAKIFDPFFSTKDTGTGLGLPITFSIIKDHDGTIELQSEVGAGTTFTVKFCVLK